MSKAILGQTLTTDASPSGGSYSLGKVHNEVRKDIEKSDAKQLGSTLTKSISTPIVLLNRGPRKNYPKIRIGKEAKGDPAILSDALSKLLPHGLRVKAQEIRERLDLAEPGDNDEILTGMAGGGLPGRDPELTRALVRVLASGDGGQGHDAISAALVPLLDADGWRPLMDPVIEPILAEASATLDRGGSLKDFRERLPALFENMDDQELVQTLGRMGFSAALSGRSGLV